MTRSFFTRLCLLGLALIAAAVGCAGRTTGASDFTQAANGSWTAKLSFVGSCDTSCSFFVRWRLVGTTTWTNGPRHTIPSKVTNASASETASGLFPGAPYEYQACGRESSQNEDFCAGPDGSGGSTQTFVPGPKRVYVANATGSDISQYSTSSTGLLSPLSPAAVDTIGTPAAMAVSPNGLSLYTVNGVPYAVNQYDIGSSGKLTAKNPASVPHDGGAPGIFGVGITPDGRSLVASANGTFLDQFDIGAGGKLSSAVRAPGYPYINRPNGLAVSPNGKSVYVANTSGNNILQYDVGTTGALTAKNPLLVASGGGSLPVDIAVRPDGKAVYVANNSGNIAQFSVDTAGRLSAKSPALVTTPGPCLPSGIAVSPDGSSVYLSCTYNQNGTGTVVGQYDVAEDGRLTAKSPASVKLSGSPASDVAVSADGKSAYVTVTSLDALAQFSVGAGGRLSPKSPATVPTGDGPSGIAVTP
ncbi:MAG: beta-propeller fold lactonase family protein [Thermoleophilaceae bacterium]|nr:beta-propeller fold lactonase family protein [Thermoleophilaceae bacterium]